MPWQWGTVDRRRPVPFFGLLGVILLAIALARPASPAAAQEAAFPDTGRTSARAPESEGREPGLAPDGSNGRVIRDSRLDADSTLFPYEWPALDRLAAALLRLRPALESRAVAELTNALPEVDGRADTLLADSVPSLLVHRSGELRDRMRALRDALQLTAELAPAAQAASGATGTGSQGTVGGFPVLLRPGQAEVGELEDTLDAWADTLNWPYGQAADSAGAAVVEPDTGDSAEPDSSAAADPVEAYLDAWRLAYGHAEAILHRMRDPAGTDLD